MHACENDQSNTTEKITDRIKLHRTSYINTLTDRTPFFRLIRKLTLDLASLSVGSPTPIHKAYIRVAADALTSMNATGSWFLASGSLRRAHRRA
jgi:hypothetical protein